MIKAVVGANWGDEGKGKITDMLAQEADIIVRFQGGANAGHTIVNDYGKFALHTLPSGVFYNHTTSVIGNGVALNIPVFFKEYNEVVERGVPAPKIMISDRAQIVMPYHILFDQYEEERLGGKSFGSTKSGIAPFYSDKYAKIGFQVHELFDDDALKEKIAHVVETKNIMLEHLYHKPLLDPNEIYEELMKYKEMVAPYVGDVSLFLWNALKEGKEILLEGQLGSLKDPDHGIYPMVTSSSTLAAYGAIGAGVPPYEIKKIITVCKAYSSAVGAGAFPKSLVKKLMSLEDAVETVENTAQQPDVRDVWDGLTVLLQSTDAVCREQPMLPLQYLMCLAIWMRYRYAQVTRSTERLLQISRPQLFSRRQNLFLKYCRDGKQISAESRIMKIFRKTAVNM